MSSPVLQDMLEAAARFKRERIRVIGTPEQESLRRLAEALAGGATVHVCEHVPPGRILTALGTAWLGNKGERKVFFHGEQERDEFMAALKRAGAE